MRLKIIIDNEDFIEMEGWKEYVHDCVIAVTERGAAIMIKSEPSLYEHDVFDGDYLNDNIHTSEKDIPTEMGIYKCKINVIHSKTWTDCGYEYDAQSSISDVVKLDIKI